MAYSPTDMGSLSTARPEAHRAIAVWLFVVAALVAATVLVGGLTRLTDSGLSITEWRPVTGVIPPLSEAEWAAEFAKYQASPEYRFQNAGMDLAAFKNIFWWEWGHRLLGRLIGIVFAVPFVWFVATGRARGRLALWLAALLAIGGLQGLIGWIMVASGLVGERTDVSHVKLAAHLGLAVLIYALLVAMALRLWAGDRVRVWAQAPRRTAIVLVVAIYMQIVSGALVAGLDAGVVYNTWPLIDGAIIPRGLVFGAGAVDDHLTVQFWHRMLAYAVGAFTVLVAVRAMKSGAEGHRIGGVLAIVVLTQLGLGIATLVSVAPLDHLWLAAAHQIGALVLLTVGLILAHRAWVSAIQ